MTAVISVIGETVPDLDDEERRNFQLNLLLGTAFGATIGGVATLVGTPPNAFLAGYLADNHGLEISFARWMLVGVPVTIVLLPLADRILTKADLARLAARLTPVGTTSEEEPPSRRRLH